jgi:hypothetical protein
MTPEQMADPSIALLLREFGSAGAVVLLAIYVIGFQGKIIRENTAALTQLATLINTLMDRRHEPRGNA